MQCTVLILASLTACAMTPQPPPEFADGRDRISQGGIEVLPYVPTRVVVNTPDAGDVVVRTRFEGHDQHPALFYFDPPRYRITHRLSDRLQWGGTVGLTVLAAELRTRWWEGGVPVVASVGAQVVPYPSLALSRLALPWDLRVLVAVQPRIGSLQLLLGIGLSAGKRQHLLYVPDGPVAHYGVDQQVSSELGFERNEAWIESVAGFSFEIARTRITLAMQPFYVVAHGSPALTACGQCSHDTKIQSAEADWGAAFTLMWLR